MRKISDVNLLPKIFKDLVQEGIISPSEIAAKYRDDKNFMKHGSQSPCENLLSYQIADNLSADQAHLVGYLANHICNRVQYAVKGWCCERCEPKKSKECLCKDFCKLPKRRFA